MSVGRRRFRIIKEIAEGGFGKVYLAEQISSDGFSRIVAIKLLHAKWSSHDEVVMRTRDEARLLGLIRHQHIVKVEDLTSIDGKCAIVMEYLEGVDLKWMISFLKERDQVFPRAALFDIILAASSALDAAYNGTPLQGGDPLRVIHRDIKPSNIFVTIAGGVKVLDFGTARANFAEREAKTQALAFGSQGYMAPERMLGEEDTPAADIFSLGITLYELLALESFGRIPPRPNKFAKKIDERVASFPLSGPKEWNDQVRDTLRLMLAYEPGKRATASQLVEIMEILAQDSADMGLRRFCRTLVSEAKTELPVFDTGDPLNGRVVNEDASSSFARSSASSTPAPVAQAPLSAPPMSAGLASPPSMKGPPVKTVKPAVSSASGPTGGRGTPQSTSAPMESGGGGMGIGVAVVGLMVLVGGGLGILLLAGSLLGGYHLWGTSGETPVPSPEPVVEPAPPVPESGGRVVSADRREGVPTAKVVLKYSDPAGGTIVISGGEGFKAEWDGKAPFEVGPLGDGRYSTSISPAGGKKIRGKSFTVNGKKKGCEFTFGVADKSWTGGCK